MLVNAKMFRMSSSTDPRLPAGRRRIAAVQLVEQPLFVRRQRALHPVQEQRRLVEQSLGRLDVLDDAGLRQAP